MINRARIPEALYQEEKRKVLDLLARLQSFEETTPEATQRRVAECENNIWQFAHFYLEHYFTTETQAEFHGDWVKLALAIELLIAIAAPRGFSKSTIFSFLLILHSICYGKKKFIVLMMETFDKAEMQTWRVLLELRYNPRIVSDFGKLVSEESARGDFTTVPVPDRPQGTRLLAMGTGMSMRGLIHAQYRPDLFIGDDLESRALARNPQRVAQLLDLILADYYPAMCAEDFSFVIIGTIICKGSALDRLRKISLGEDSDYESASEKVIFKKYRAIEFDEKGIARSTYPELHPLQKLYDMRDVIGQLRFDSEKQNEPRENSGFIKEDDIRHWTELPEELDLRHVIIPTDPSFSETGDNKAMFPMVKYDHSPKRADWNRWKDSAGKMFDERRYFILLACYNRQESVDLFIEKLYAFQEGKFKPKYILIEGNFNQRAFFERELARYAMQKKIPNLRVRYKINKHAKDDRIAALDSYFRRGEVLLPNRSDSDTETTVTQLTRYDGGKKIKDDGPDAIAMGIDDLLTGEVKKKMRF